MMTDEAISYWGKNVSVLCSDGQIFEGQIRWQQTHADEPDEPESIGVQYEDDEGPYLVEIPTEEIVSITEI